MTAATYNQYHQTSGRQQTVKNSPSIIEQRTVSHWTNAKKRPPVDWSARTKTILGAFTDSSAPETSGKLGTYLP